MADLDHFLRADCAEGGGHGSENGEFHLHLHRDSC